MKFPRTINICAPGMGASCALCCGSHNLVLAPGDTSAVKGSGTIIKSLTPGSNHPELSMRLPLRYSDAMSCPHVAILDAQEGRIGCRIYESSHEEDASLRQFFDATCRTFYCRAWDSLSDQEVLFAASLTGDWYYYSLLIQEIVTLRKLYRRYETAKSMPSMELEKLKIFLEERLNCTR